MILLVSNLPFWLLAGVNGPVTVCAPIAFRCCRYPASLRARERSA